MGSLADKINEMIRKFLEGSDFTSASPGHINKFITNTNLESPDLLEMIEQELSENESIIKEKEDTKTAVKKLKEFDKGNVGEIQRFTSQQFSNVRGFATNPFQFIIGNVFKKFAKGAGIAALALVFFEVVKFILNELMKPGRFLDRRFRRDIENEFLSLRSREEKQQLLTGTREVIITTIGGLRGGQGQISSNLRAIAGLQSQPIPRTFATPGIIEQASGIDFKFGKRPRSVFR